MATIDLTVSSGSSGTSGSGGGSSDGWTLAYKDTTSGDIVGVTPTTAPTPPAGTDHIGWQMEITDDTSTRTEDLRMGVFLNAERLVRVNGEATIRLRPTYRNQSTDAITYGSYTATKAATPGTATAGLTITPNFSSITEGQAVIFKASLSGANLLEPLLDADFHWTFDDAGTYDRLPADFPWSRDRNVAYGPTVGHVFRSTGTYTVTCNARVGGTTYTETTTITVSAFSGTTVTVGASGKDYTTIAAALAANTSGNLRIQVADDETFTSSVNLASGYNNATIIIERDGLGTSPPVLNQDGGSSFGFNALDGADIVIRGLDIIGTYDPTDINASSSGDTGVSVRSDSELNSLTIADCLFENCSTGISILPVALDNVVMSNTVIDGWYDYGLQGPDLGLSALEGCMIAQNAGAVTGGAYGLPAPDHGPIRVSRPYGDMAIQCSYLASHNSWTSGSQPCIRWNSDQQTDNGPYTFNADRLLTEGGTGGVGTHVSRPVATFSRIVFDKFAHVTTQGPGVGFRIHCPGTRLRNGVVMMPEVFSETGIGPSRDGLLGKDADFSEVGSIVSDIDVIVTNVSLLDLRTEPMSYQPNKGTSRPFNPVDASVTDTSAQVVNYVAHGPNGVIDGTTADAPLDLTTDYWPLRYKGRNVLGEAKLPFASGSSEPSIGATLTGATSGATGTVAFIIVTSGTWAGSDAAGWFCLTDVSGTFGTSESLQVSSSTVAAAGGSAVADGTPLSATGNVGLFGKLPVPQTGSAAIGDATGDWIAYRDFYGNVRGANPSRGAFEAG